MKNLIQMMVTAIALVGCNFDADSLLGARNDYYTPSSSTSPSTTGTPSPECWRYFLKTAYRKYGDCASVPDHDSWDSFLYDVTETTGAIEWTFRKYGAGDFASIRSINVRAIVPGVGSSSDILYRDLQCAEVTADDTVYSKWRCTLPKKVGDPDVEFYVNQVEFRRTQCGGIVHLKIQDEYSTCETEPQNYPVFAGKIRLPEIRAVAAQ